jgi:oligopeptide transport system ATP-binding protein
MPLIQNREDDILRTIVKEDNLPRLLTVDHLCVSFFTDVGEVQAVRDISFSISSREIIGIVGESGSGKSVSFLSVMGLLPHPGRVTNGDIVFEGEDLLKKSPARMRRLRGSRLAMIFQDPMTALNPLFTIGDQITETLTEHRNISKKQAREQAAELLRLVGIPAPEKSLSAYPHEFSGGMRQRVMIAIAVSCEPSLLIADEPTTALDVTIQAQVLQLLQKLNQKLNMSTILITHDLGCVASVCSRVLIMYGGQIMEQGSDEDIFYRPGHPYTMGLLNSVPKLNSEEKKRLIPIPGTPPDMLYPPPGCPFHPRCAVAMEICAKNPSPYFSVNAGHEVRCWLCHPDAPGGMYRG